MKKMLFLLAMLTLSIQGTYQAVKLDVPTRTVPTGVVKTLSVTGTVPAEHDVWSPMVAPVNALAMCMMEKQVDYQLNNPEFLWNSLYYMVGVYGTGDWRVIDQGDSYFIPVELVEDYAYALFGDKVSLCDIPEELEDFISYDKASSGYIWNKGDSALVDSRVCEMTSLGGKRHEVTGELYDLSNGTVICEFLSILEENDSMFGYHIENFVIL